MTQILSVSPIYKRDYNLPNNSLRKINLADLNEISEIVSNSVPKFSRTVSGNFPETSEIHQSHDSGYYREKYNMFEQEFVKLAERENIYETEEIHQKTKIEKSKKKNAKKSKVRFYIISNFLIGSGPLLKGRNLFT